MGFDFYKISTELTWKQRQENQEPSGTTETNKQKQEAIAFRCGFSILTWKRESFHLFENTM